DGPDARLSLAGEHPRAAERAQADAVARDRAGGDRGIAPRPRVRIRRTTPRRRDRAGWRTRKVSDRVVPPRADAGLRPRSLPGRPPPRRPATPPAGAPIDRG